MDVAVDVDQGSHPGLDLAEEVLAASKIHVRQALVSITLEKRKGY